MTGRLALRVTLLAIAFALATILFGWWGVPLVAVIWGLVAHATPGPGATSAAAAAVAWAALLGWTALSGDVAALAGILGGIMQAPGAALVALTILFPAAVAWAGARMASGSMTLLRARSHPGGRRG